MARPTNEQRILIAQRRTRVLAMRLEGIPYDQIAADLGVSEAVARKDYERAAAQARADLAGTVEQARAVELLKLSAMERECWKVLRAKHIIVQQGKIVLDGDGNALDDDAPVLQAVDRLERISARRAKLRGLDAPAKVEVDDGRRAQIEAYAAELAAWVGDVDDEGAGDAPGEAAGGEGQDRPA